MSSQSTQLRYGVFVAPEKPFNGPLPEVGDPPMWDPTTATLIYGDHDAVLIDALCTTREANALANWVELHDRRLTTIYITHAHFDHWFGLPVLLERFPSARAVASLGTVRAMGRVTRADTYRALFPNQLADRIIVPDRLDSDHFDLEGHALRVVETGHTDSVDSTSLHAPDLGLIVSGDVVYNHCHMFVGDTTRDSRMEWVAALDNLATLHPTAVVAGHKDPTRGDLPSIISESRGYLEAYGQLYDAGLRGPELFEAMVSRYADWVSPQQFLLLGFAYRRADASTDRAAVG
jgi:glyoxylase-like metal-dependent hydrolase (beta-lactamase superfamily II)